VVGFLARHSRFRTRARGGVVEVTSVPPGRHRLETTRPILGVGRRDVLASLTLDRLANPRNALSHNRLHK